jgi:hypothetical protein
MEDGRPRPSHYEPDTRLWAESARQLRQALSALCNLLDERIHHLDRSIFLAGSQVL